MEGLVNYHEYRMERAESIKYLLIAAGVLFAISYIFFNSPLLALFFSGGAYFYLPYKRQELARKRQTELNLQFKDALYSLASSLRVGRSLESAFLASLEDLRLLYPNPDTDIIREFSYICRRLEFNQPLELALLEFGQRSEIADIINFAEVIAICKSTGGNLVEVVKNTASILSNKIEISQDIELLLVKQKYGQKILNVMPVVFIGLIKFGGSGYMDALYTSLSGYLMMGIALAIIVVANLISRRIFAIKV